jgi:lipid-A-disaccharide synthase
VTDAREPSLPAPQPGSSLSILVVAGEISGDMHAAGLVRALRARRPDLRFFGIGGDELRAEGVEILYDARDMAVTGFAEVVRRFPFFRRVFFELLEAARRRRPDMVLLVDYPGFNLRFAEQAHRLGLRVVYYVCPQVWAWHRSRIPRMARSIDRMITIFPFEPACFAGSGLRTDFAGHPLVDEAKAALSQPDADLPWSGEPRVALLPGSRPNEIANILPCLWRAAAHLQERRPSASFIVPCPSADIDALVRKRIGELGSPAPSNWAVVTGQTRQVLRQARAAAVASGTATIESALMGCPMIVVYRTAPLTYAIGRMLVRVPHIGMVNIVAGREVCREFIQHGADPGRMAEALTALCGKTPERARMVEGLKDVAARLGGGGARERAADIVIEELGRIGRDAPQEQGALPDQVQHA